MKSNISTLLLLLVSFTMFSQILSDTEKAGIQGEINELNELIKSEPTAEHYYYRGKFHGQLGHHTEALTDLNRSIELDKNTFESWLERGKVNIAMKEFQNAVDDLTEALKLNPGSRNALSLRAFARRNMGHQSGAEEDYTKSIALKPDAETYFNRGLIRYETGQFANAIADFTAALELDSQYLEALIQRAISKSMLRDKTAIEDYNSYIRQNPQDGEAYFNRALHLLNNNIKGDYCADLSRAIQLGFTEAVKVRKEVCK